ncbi:hypothetical protein PsorP6_003995 [Peronosclerospora sorghi]|uniref:Uncharacterized protein n=1 Tax=Peronosclerospora sorghi TaxID=230839 RepID=A0ACC0VQ16_9STRA|nr:hypothetical protein PsorP6_003995 [Peronosclerospora sorghi]
MSPLLLGHKRRLVAQGFLQTQARIMFKQFDVETAFLNGNLEETVYMSPTDGIRVANDMVQVL